MPPQLPNSFKIALDFKSELVYDAECVIGFLQSVNLRFHLLLVVYPTEFSQGHFLPKCSGLGGPLFLRFYV